MEYTWDKIAQFELERLQSCLCGFVKDDMFSAQYFFQTDAIS